MTRAMQWAGPADDEAFARSRFRSAPLAGVLADVQHCLDTRGRPVASVRYLQTVFTDVALPKVTMATVGPFTALPGEDEYHVQLLVCPLIMVPEDLHRVLSVHWQVETADSTGANTSTGPWQAASVVLPPRRRATGPALLGWPSTQGAALSEVAVPLTIHRIDQALSRDDRVMTLYGWSDYLDGDQFAFALRSIFVTGHRRD